MSVVLAGLLGGRPVRAAEPPLAGVWELIPELSDRQGPQGPDAFPESRGDPTAVLALVRPPLKLTITVRDSAVTFAPEWRAPQRVVPGRPEAADTVQDGSVRWARAQWKGEKLVVNRRLVGVAKTKESYRVDGQDRLIVDVDVSPESWRGTISVRRVYRRQAGTR